MIAIPRIHPWSRRRVQAVLMALAIGFPLSAPGNTEAERERAVELAREGHYTDALMILDSLPPEATVIHDRIAVASWAGHHERAWSLREAVDIHSAPDYVLAALGHSGRELRRLHGAAAYYGELARRFPERSDGPAGLAFVLADSGQLDQALDTAHAGVARFANDAEMLFALGYVHRMRGEYAQAIGAFHESATLDTSRNEVFRYLLGTASAAGAPRPGLERLETWPDRVPAAELMQLYADRAALAVRWGALEPPSVAERFSATDRAIALLEDNLRRAERGGEDWDGFARITRYDLMVALRDRQRMQAVLDLYDQIRTDDEHLPAYVLEAVGNAHLHLEQPERAVDYLEHALALQRPPGNETTQRALFYALVESERHDDARELIDAVVEQTPAVFVNPRTNLHFPNPDRRDAELHAALARLFADRPDLAQKRIDALADAAPFNPDLRAERANIYRTRGWKAYALEEGLIGLSTEPEHIGLRLNKAAALLDLERTAEATALIGALRAEYPEHKGVARLVQRLEAHSGMQLSLRARASRADGGELGTRARHVEGELRSALIDDRHRVFALGRLSRATFDDQGTVTYRRGGMGLQRTHDGSDYAAALTTNRAGGTHTGVLVSGRWRINDHWAVSVSADSVDPQTPLRALDEDIHARTVAASAAWNAHESRGVTLHLRYSDFTDGNRRRMGGLSVREDLYSGPRYHLRAYFDVYRSDNTLAGTSYFNPDDDLSAAVTLRNQWRTWRRYQRTFEQVLALTAGQYWQSGFDRGPIGALRYEHRWQQQNRYELIYGISRSARRFDGVREDETEVFGRLDWSF